MLQFREQLDDSYLLTHENTVTENYSIFLLLIISGNHKISLITHVTHLATVEPGYKSTGYKSTPAIRAIL
jgi:hypothetical protein